MHQTTNYGKLIEQQRDYYSSSATLDAKYRIYMLKRLKAAILKNEKAIAKALHEDLGKSMQEVITTEIGQAIGEINYLIKHVKRLVGKKRKNTNRLNFPSRSYTIREPYGVTLVMSPWNYPFQLAMAPVAGAIAGGNTVILKPSEISIATSLVLERILSETFSPEYVAVVQGGVEETTALLEERFDMIFFTGSPKVGSIVMGHASKHLTPVVLELGGKSPCVIDKDTNLDTAVRRIIFGKATNAGQTCVAPDYLLVHEAVKDLFYDKFHEVADDFYSHEFKDNDDYGKIISERHYDRLVGMMHDGRIEYGGGHDRERRHIDLTLIEVTDMEKPIMNEEIFGPLLPVVTYRSLDEVQTIIGRNPDPLAFYVFSNNRQVVETLLEKVHFGGGCVNDTLLHLSNEHLPFGGRGTSGMGSYHGRYSFDAFTHEKAILHSRMFFDLVLKYPPFKKRILPLLKWLMY